MNNLMNKTSIEPWIAYFDLERSKIKSVMHNRKSKSPNEELMDIQSSTE